MGKGKHAPFKRGLLGTIVPEENDDKVTVGDLFEKPDDTENVDTTEQEDEKPSAAEDEKTFTQADLDRLLQKRLKRQEDQFAKKMADYDTLKADADAFRKLQDEKSTDAQRWEKERADFTAALAERDEKLNKLERANLIADLATEKGLPKSFWKRVAGESAEDIEDDIDSILNDLGGTREGKEKTPKAPAAKSKQVYGGGGENESPEPDTDAIVAKIPRGPQFRVDKSRTYQ